MTALPETLELTVGLDEAADPALIAERAAKKLGVQAEALSHCRIVRRSIDARGGRARFLLRLAFDEAPPDEQLGLPLPREVAPPSRIVIVGAGPAGLFCAYELARHGIASTVLDRGKEVQPRRRDLALLNRGERVDRDSNYCFGEGGAGTYSDGKLYTRAVKRGPVRDVLETLARHGAPRDILVDARPHVGSNKLPKVVRALRDRLTDAGVEVRFETKVLALRTGDRGASRRVTGVLLEGGEELEADAVVLATGHSARDVYLLLERAAVALEPKPFALGVRIEHPQPFINGLQYGRDAGHPALPAAAYRIAAQIDGRGVFSFCMCPGGWIVPSMTEPETVVVNGMSLSKRDSAFANSGLVVTVEPAQWEKAGHRGSLGGIRYQETVERAAAAAGGAGLKAPAVRAADFLRGAGSSSLPETSYRPGLSAADLRTVLDSAGVPIADALRAALERFEKNMPGYGGTDAVLVGVESRTSAPVRIPRDPERLHSPSLAGLYPAGEGAGYAGGIISAALDGIRIAEQLVAAKVAAR
jgi:uncharacterized FAD-dependent dehydrogenase